MGRLGGRGTTLEIQRLRIPLSVMPAMQGTQVRSLVIEELRSHLQQATKPAMKILCAATKTQHSQINKNFFKKRAGDTKPPSGGACTTQPGLILLLKTLPGFLLPLG